MANGQLQIQSIRHHPGSTGCDVIQCKYEADWEISSHGQNTDQALMWLCKEHCRELRMLLLGIEQYGGL